MYIQLLFDYLVLQYLSYIVNPKILQIKKNKKKMVHKLKKPLADSYIGSSYS